MAEMKDKKSVIALVPDVYKSYIKSEAQSSMEKIHHSAKQKLKRKQQKLMKTMLLQRFSGSEAPFDDEMNDWLFSDSTKVGSKKYYIDEEAGYIYIVLKTSNASIEDDETYTVRHILVTPESDNDSLSSSNET